MIIDHADDHCNRTVSNMMAGGIARRDEKNSLLLMQMGQVSQTFFLALSFFLIFSVFGTTFLES